MTHTYIYWRVFSCDSTAAKYLEEEEEEEKNNVHYKFILTRRGGARLSY